MANVPGDGRDAARTRTRVLGAARPLDYSATQAFFDERAARAATQEPLTAVLYQDANPDLARQRDEVERALVLGWLPTGKSFRALDIGCGIARWGHHLASRASAYQGVDFSPGLVELARASLGPVYPPGSFAVDVLAATDLAADRLTIPPPFDLVVQAGLLVYLNDEDVGRVIAALPALLADEATIYLREPVATGDRLTLDRHWSDELKQEYSAAYRPVDFYREVIERTLVPTGFRVTRSQGLDPGLANRAETSQHFFLLER